MTENLEIEKAKIVEDKKMEFLTKASIIDIQNVPIPDTSETKENVTISTASSESVVVLDNKEEHQMFGDDMADGNVMSMKKDVKFKDILTAKLAKGPRTVGKRKTSSSNAEAAISQSDLLFGDDKPHNSVVAASPLLAPTSPKSVDNTKSSQRTEKETKPIPNAEQASGKIEVEKKKPDPQNPIDDEVSEPILESLTKSRAKLPINRRAPTRKALKAMGESGTDQVDFGLPIQQEDPLPLIDDTQKKGSEAESAKIKVIPEPVTTPSSEKTEETKSLKSEEGGTSLSMVVKVVEAVSPPQVEKTNLVAQETSEVKVAIRAEPIGATTSVPLKPEDSPRSPKENFDPVKVADDSGDDDLFGPPPMPDVIKANHDPLFGTPSSDEDDLFAAEKKTKLRSATATAASLFDDDDSDDDLFASH